MKVYSISKWAFAGICLLIVVLPVSRQWKLMARGERTRGTVLEYTLQARENRFGDRIVFYASNIEYEAGDTTITVHGPESIEYARGRRITVFYNPEAPSEHCLLTFSCLYLNNYSVLPLILLVVWGAFYLSFNSYRKNPRTATRAGSHDRTGHAGSHDRTGYAGNPDQVLHRGSRQDRERDPYFRLRGRDPRLKPGPSAPPPEKKDKK